MSKPGMTTKGKGHCTIVWVSSLYGHQTSSEIQSILAAQGIEHFVAKDVLQRYNKIRYCVSLYTVDWNNLRLSCTLSRAHFCFMYTMSLCCPHLYPDTLIHFCIVKSTSALDTWCWHGVLFSNESCFLFRNVDGRRTCKYGHGECHNYDSIVQMNGCGGGNVLVWKVPLINTQHPNFCCWRVNAV